VVAAGKVRYVGFSDVPASVAAQSQTIAQFRGSAPITALQLEYSLLERTPEGELLPMDAALGLGAMPWSPLRGGQLSGKYVRDGATPVDSPRAGHIAGPSEREWVVIDMVARGLRSSAASAPRRSRWRWYAADPSTPSLDFPAAITAGPGPMLGFGGATVDGVTLPVWPSLRHNATRY